jgi:hypothetical protein
MNVGLAGASTVKLCVAVTAGAQVALPDCDAEIAQPPDARNVTVVPDTEHTVGVVEANPTARPELAAAATV